MGNFLKAYSASVRLANIQNEIQKQCLEWNRGRRLTKSQPWLAAPNVGGNFRSLSKLECWSLAKLWSSLITPFTVPFLLSVPLWSPRPLWSSRTPVGLLYLQSGLDLMSVWPISTGLLSTILSILGLQFPKAKCSQKVLILSSQVLRNSHYLQNARISVDKEEKSIPDT